MCKMKCAGISRKMQEFMYIIEHVYIYIYIYIYIYTHTHISIYLCVCECVCVHTHAHTPYTHIHLILKKRYDKILIIAATEFTQQRFCMLP